MQRESRKLEYEFKRNVCIVLAILFVVIGAPGCASNHKTTKTTTVVTSNDQQNNPVTQKSETTTTATETKTEHPSILGSTLHAIGWVIALPFRLVGGLIGWIF